MQTKRLHLLDELRGLAFVSMFLYHTYFDLVEIFGVTLPGIQTPGIHAWQLSIGISFILISGFSCRLSKENRKRGLIVFGLALALTVVTWLVLPSERILFGVLHFLGLSMILYSFLAPLLDRVPPYLGIVFSLALFLITYSVPERSYPGGFFFWLGFPSAAFFSADYYPLIPWFFLFLTGSFLGKLLLGRELPAFAYRQHLRPLAFLGRHTLIAYLIHQPLIYGILWVLFRLIASDVG